MIHNNFESTIDDNRPEQQTEISNPPLISEIEETITTESAHNISENDQPISDVLNEVKDELTIILPANNQNDVDIVLATSNATDVSAQSIGTEVDNVVKKGNVAAMIRLFDQNEEPFSIC